MRTMITMNKEIECLKCGYEWISRVKNPKECPDCKARLNKQRGGVK